jgi:hypothetical protein
MRHLRTIALDPPPGSPDPVGHYAATMAETAAMLALVRTTVPDCRARCSTDPALPLCVPCAIRIARHYIRHHHRGFVSRRAMDAAESRLQVEAERYGLHTVIIEDASVFLLLMDCARTLAGVSAA